MPWPAAVVQTDQPQGYLVSISDLKMQISLPVNPVEHEAIRVYISSSASKGGCRACKPLISLIVA
jgi:hypothetical protein